MSLTHEESLLFATLWLKAGEDFVLRAEDADTVARVTLRHLDSGLTPCARERLPQFEARPAKRPAKRDERYSSWVH